MSESIKKRFPSITSIDIQSDGNTSFLRAARNGQLEKVLEHLKTNIDINTSNSNGLNALHLASKDGHVEIVKELLKRGAIVDAATKKGNTALHIASLAGQEEVVKLLVQNGASVNVQSQNGFTPLYMAAQENHDNVVKYLLSNGANQSLSTEDGFTPLAVAMQQGHDKVVAVLLENDTRGKVRLPALHIAAKKDDVKAAKLLLENEHNPDVTSKSGFTPLHIASHYGNQQIAILLIQKGADVNYAAKHNITPLHVAAKWGKTNMVALLLENGASIEAKTRDGLTPLHCAARSGHEQVVDMLLEKGAPLSSKTKNGLAPLHMAAQGDHVDAARILLFHRAPVDEVTVDYLTALHVAAHCGHVRVAKLLLDRQADANARALNGFTPLHIACKKNRIKVVELLLKHGASIGATTESGLTPLHVASFMGCMNIVIYLLQHDANPDMPTVRGETPLHLAARANQTDIIRILLRNGAQVDARAREQQTPLHIASRLGNVDIVMLLLQHGAKVDSTTKDMYTALHIAAKEGQDEVAGVLIDNGASINATTKKGFTPLHLASKYGNLKVAKLLLQKEAPVDAQGKNGVTPLHVAAHYDHQNVALLLLDKGASPNATAKNGHTPLHIAARKNQMDIANTLLEYGAPANAESKAGFTPLHLSAQEGHTDMSALLLEHNANANYEAKNGLTALHLCAQEDRVPVAEILVKNGNADVNSATKAGYTPLHMACHYGQANMVRFLLKNGADISTTTQLGYTPLHQAAQQGHANIINILLENKADPNAETTNGQTPLQIAQKLGYITVIETLKVVTTVTDITTTTTTTIEEKYRVQAPEAMQETFMSDSEEEGGEEAVLGDQTYRYLTADEMKSLGDDSLPIDVTRDERIDSNRMVSSTDSNIPPHHFEDSISPEHISKNYVEYIKKYSADNVDIARHPINIGFLVSFLVDARGGAMRGCRHSGVRVIVPPRCAPSPTRITCRYVRPQRTPHPPPLMEGEALASRVLELGPVGAKFLGPVIIEVPHFAALRGKEREIVILRSDNGESWKEHSVDATDEVLNKVLHDSFEAEDLNQMEDIASGRITRIVTQDFPQYFAVVSRVRQEVHAIGPEGGMVSSTVVPQVQAIFPEGALTKKIKVGLQAQPIDPELTAKLLGHGVAVSPVVTVEPRRRKFHKAIRLNMPAPTAHSQGMINQYSGSAPTLRLLCSITGGTTRAQWEDVTGSTPLTFVNDVVSFTTTVSARFWLMDCRNIDDATKMATELYKEAIHVPFMAKFVVFAKRVDPLEARLRVFCMTDDKEDKTLEHQEHFTEVAKSRDVEVLEGKPQYVEFAGNLVPITKTGEQLQFSFRAFRENRLPFSVRVKDQHAEAVGRCLFMKEARVLKGEPPQQPICILNIVLPEDIVVDTISLTDSETSKRHMYLSEFHDYYRPDTRLADMSNLLGEDWVELAHQLGLTESEINVIKSEYPESRAKQAQSMLRMWLSQSGNMAQTNTLENALRRIGREDIIPQCLNVDQPSYISRITKEEDMGYRLKKDSDKERKSRKEDEFRSPEKEKLIEHYDKYSAEEKVFIKSESEEEEDNFDKTVTERREVIQKRLSAERQIPASSQRREIVQEINDIKRQSIVEDTLEHVKHMGVDPKLIDVKPVTKKSGVSETVEVKTTLPSTDSGVFENDLVNKHVITKEIVETHRIVTEKVTHATEDGARLLEGVTQRFEDSSRTQPRFVGAEDPKSPKFSKTPPPSPADFLLQNKEATSTQEWDARKPTREAASLDSPAAQQEAGSELTPEADHPLTSPETNKHIPLPKPRSAKIPEMSLDLDNAPEPKLDKIISPVRDDLLDDYDKEELATYSDRKKFWENVSKEPHKRMSLHDITPSEKEILARKRASLQEFTQPPVPKPRSVVQASHSLAEAEEPIEQTDQISTIIEEQGEKIMTEYQASFQPPTERKEKHVAIERSESQLEKSESIDSDKAQKGSSQFAENTGYISDSEDVENVISDSEIEDRVPQIRERQMSVFAPPVAAQRKTIYERSASLPTEDLYEVSARSIQLRKAYYEQQIKKEMIEEQFASDNEEETSPERKTLLTLQDERFDILKTAIDKRMTTMEEEDDSRQDEVESTTSVKDLKKTFESSSTRSQKELSLKELEFQQQSNTISQIEEDAPPEKMSVKDRAKSYEENITKSDSKKSLFDNMEPVTALKSEIDIDDVNRSEEFSLLQGQFSLQKDIENDSQYKSMDSQTSVSSDKSGDLLDSYLSKESLEVHVDKSELEESEKSTEYEQESESQCINNLVNGHQKHVVDDIPEITLSLSGPQRRISEESDEYAEIDEKNQPFSHIPEQDEELEIKTHEETVDDTVWEVVKPSEMVHNKELERTPSLELNDFEQVENIVMRPATIEELPEKVSIKENISERLTKEIHDKLNEKLKTVDVAIEKSVTEEVDDKNLDELKDLMLEEALGKHQLPLTKSKEGDFSSSLHEDSEISSDVQMDQSESLTSEKIKSESHSDIEKIILDSLHQQRVEPEEAKKIATALVEEIEIEIQKRGQIRSDEHVGPQQDLIKITPEVSSYLKNLAAAKGLDEREVELVESVLARREREMAKLGRSDTQASSMEITDEDLRFSGTETDYAHTLEQQIDQLEAERVHDLALEYDLIQEEKDDSDFKSSQKNIQSSFTDSLKEDKSYIDRQNVILEEDESLIETINEETKTLFAQVKGTVQEISKTETETLLNEEIKHSDAEANATHELKKLMQTQEKVSDNVKETKVKTQVTEKDHSELSGKYEANRRSKEITDNITNEYQCSTEKEYNESLRHEETTEQNNIIKAEKTQSDMELRETIIEKKHSVTSSERISKDKIHEETVSVSNKTIELTDPSKILEECGVKSESTQSVSKESIKRVSSSDSKSSLESSKSPEDNVGISKKSDSDSNKLSSDPVIFRTAKSDLDSSSSSLRFKPDRKSGVEFEAYSSSGESHYQSFEIDSGKSRPCSSDVEGLLPGSSEYDTALTSQDYSARSHITSSEYKTAVSSSKDSMKSLDSESSGHLGSVEVSEHSETLVPSTSDIDGDMLDSLDPQLLEDTEFSSGWHQVMPGRQVSDFTDSENVSGVGESIDNSEEEINDSGNISDSLNRMKRSAEMHFQPVPRVLAQDSPQGESDEKLGTSLEDGSILSVSVSSTSSAIKTVVENMAGSVDSVHLSMEEYERTMRSSQESLPHTPTQISATVDVFTSTPEMKSDLPIQSVTMTTSSVKENDVQSVSTQINTSLMESAEEIASLKSKPEEIKKKGHRRTESQSFVSSVIGISTVTQYDANKFQSDLTESDKYLSKLSLKEEASAVDEKKDIDETERDEQYETEADQGFHQDLREGKYNGSDNEMDLFDSRPQSRFSKSDSDKERPVSTAFSDDRVESELADLLKSSLTDETDPIERPASPEPRDSSLEFAGELDNEFSPRTKSVSLHKERKRSSSDIHKDPLEQRDSHGKSSTTSSEKSSFEEAEAEAAFNMVAHISPAHKIKQICPIIEDDDAEKLELELKEKAQKEKEERLAKMRELSPGFIPDITITEHLHPVDQDDELELQEEIVPQEPKPIQTQIKSEEATIGTDDEKKYTEKTFQDSKIERDTDSPQSSDSFELLEKPDIIDDFVVIEEVAKEAQETDAEGKSVSIGKKPKNKHDTEVEEYLVTKSAPTPLTGVGVKCYPDGTSSSEELGFDMEESPPKPPGEDGKIASTKVFGSEYDRELESNRQWIEQQFQGDQAAMRAAGYGYEMEFERGPLEDIKEEDINDFAASSYGSQKDGSLGSVKDSYSSTPEYDVLAGRKYFTRSGENDDISMSSLQEFEKLEQAMSLEMKRFYTGSDSSSSGSSKAKHKVGDDISVSSLKEFEGLEKACIAAHKIEIKIKEEEDMLTQIEEGQESIASESESCETVSGTEKKVTDTDDDEDYEKRMFEIDEIIKQAQTNVERFIDIKDMEKTESLGRGDSVEEVSRVPDLELDNPIVKSTTKVQWKENDDVMVSSTDSLDFKQDKKKDDSSDSLDQLQHTGGDIMTASTDSIEFQLQKAKENVMTDSIEMRDEKSYMVSSDSLELGQATSSGINYIQTDSIDEDGSRIGGHQDHSHSSSTGRDFDSSAKEDLLEQENKDDNILHSFASVDPTSSTATHATYQYETDSVFSGSFTSGGSNTMVSSTDTIDPAQGVDINDAVKKVWFQENISDDYGQPYVTEIIEPTNEESFSHVIHRKVEMAPEVKRVTFTGSTAEDQLRKFMDEFDEGETVEETEEVDEFGNVHTRRVVQKRFIIKDGKEEPMTKEHIEKYLRELQQPEEVQDRGVISRASIEGVMTKTITDARGQQTIVSQTFELPSSQLTSLTRIPTGSQPSGSQPTASSQATINRRRTLRYEISMEDQTEVNPREHDWRFNLTHHAEAEESQENIKDKDSKKVTDQHQLSDDMKELLKELEKETKQ